MTITTKLFLFRQNLNDYNEIEKIWDTYKLLLTDRSLKIVESDSYFFASKEHPDRNDSLIDLFKLNENGKMYLDDSEIDIILNGTIKPYLAQFK